MTTTFPSGPDRSNRPTILFVDDEPNILRSLRRELFDSGFNMHVRTSAREALPVIEAGNVAVVVTDLCMPDVDGIEFLERVHEIDPCIVRIILTGHADLVSAMEVVNRCQLFRLMIKPWDRQELLMTLRTAVAHQRLAVENYRILRENEKSQEMLNKLEAKYPGITTLPPQDLQGAYIMDREET